MNYEFVLVGIILVVFSSILYVTDHSSWAVAVFIIALFTILLGRIKRASPGGMTEPYDL